jgi:hypothetical protein
MDTVNANEESSSDAGTPAVKANSGNEVPAPVREQGPFAVNRDADQKAPSVGPRGITTIAKKSGGPSTKQGKEKSRRNAVKHGIFAKVVLLHDEPTAQFDNLLQGIRNDLQPEGTLEGVLVEKLATLMWRYRRMLIAERAEIKMERKYNSHADNRRALIREKALAIETCSYTPSHGLLGEWENAECRKTAVELLKSLQLWISSRGFKLENDFPVMRRIFGELGIIEAVGFYFQYANPENSSIRFERSPKNPPSSSEEAGKAKFVEYLQTKIDTHSRLLDLTEDCSKVREGIESVCAGVPEAARLDRILRYSASLERDFDRTLNQLERLQRMRRGQPAAPTLNVNFSG